MYKNSCYNYGDNLFVYLAGDLNTSPEYLRHLLRTKTLNIDACNEEVVLRLPGLNLQTIS